MIKDQKQETKNLPAKGLKRCERLIFNLHYSEGMTIKEIGLSLGSSSSRIYQIRSSILKRLKSYYILNQSEKIIKNTLFKADEKLPKPLTEVIQVINVELIKHLKKHPEDVYKIRPRQFEELIAEILSGFGWEVQLTPPVKDGGYDIFAISKDIANGLKTSWIIECKKNSPANKVGVKIVRALYGVKSHKQIANALLATTSSFTKGANEFKASRYDLELKGYEAILDWINQYRPNPNGKLYIKNHQLIIPKNNSIIRE